jgi:hypothetical protein
LNATGFAFARKTQARRHARDFDALLFKNAHGFTSNGGIGISFQPVRVLALDTNLDAIVAVLPRAARDLFNIPIRTRKSHKR